MHSWEYSEQFAPTADLVYNMARLEATGERQSAFPGGVANAGPPDDSPFVFRPGRPLAGCRAFADDPNHMLREGTHAR